MVRKATLSRLGSVTPTVLVLAGLMLISVGIGMVYVPAGWIAAGFGALILEWRFYSE